MCFFENDYFLNILKTYKEKTFPMLVPVIVNLAENHWHKILQESLIALKTILKEIDPFAFEESLRMGVAQKKQFAVKQDEEDRKALDKKWEKLNSKLKQTDGGYTEPDCKCPPYYSYSPVQAVLVDPGLQRTLHEDLRQGKVHEPVITTFS
jgi:serine/threonine-protein phosphatase 2A regulatory subunit B'